MEFGKFYRATVEKQRLVREIEQLKEIIKNAIDEGQHERYIRYQNRLERRINGYKKDLKFCQERLERIELMVLEEFRTII